MYAQEWPGGWVAAVERNEDDDSVRVRPYENFSSGVSTFVGATRPVTCSISTRRGTFQFRDKPRPFVVLAAWR